MIPAVDNLKYFAARGRQVTDWACDSIGGSGCDQEHEHELNAIDDLTGQLRVIAAGYGDPLVYSDGRVVRTEKEVQPGLVVSHVWRPDPATEEPYSWRSSLPSGDPDVPSPGVYEVSSDPATQSIHIRVVRTAA